ncbi:MAG: DUF2232 domain-containing protein [Sedimenticola sp.]|jgi:hypothetical protein|nr:MAG: DUF2232 domain-containing protein [Sedimenticola sp.]
MRFLASAVMQGRSQAVMVITVLAMLSFLFPPASILSSGAVALVTLRNGLKDGLLVLVFAGIACGVLAQLTLGVLLPAVGFVLLLWLPMVLLAVLLRSSRSLALALQGGVGLGLLFILVQFLQVQDPVSEWQTLLEPFSQSLVDAELIDPSQQKTLVEIMAKWMPGLIAAGFLLQSIAGLILARWWQSMLYNPGGFRQEFHQLRLSKILALATLVVVVSRLLLSDEASTFVDALMMVFIAAWFIQGLALAHGALGTLGVNSGWLIGIYLLLIFAMPHAVMVLASAGFADAWFDFRARLAENKGSE